MAAWVKLAHHVACSWKSVANSQERRRRRRKRRNGGGKEVEGREESERELKTVLQLHN